MFARIDEAKKLAEIHAALELSTPIEQPKIEEKKEEKVEVKLEEDGFITIDDFAKVQLR